MDESHGKRTGKLGDPTVKPRKDPAQLVSLTGQNMWSQRKLLGRPGSKSRNNGTVALDYVHLGNDLQYTSAIKWMPGRES